MMTLKESLQTAAIITLTYAGIIGVAKLMSSSKDMSEITENLIQWLKTLKDWDAVVLTWIATVPNLIIANPIPYHGMK